MSKPFINVHRFDSKLKGVFTQEKKYTVLEKKKAFSTLIPRLTSRVAISMIQTIIRDLDRKGNIQSENDLDASDILMEIMKWIDYTDVLKDLNEQLSDIRNLGQCPSGRCTRLYQLWLAYKDAKLEKSILLEN